MEHDIPGIGNVQGHEKTNGQGDDGADDDAAGGAAQGNPQSQFVGGQGRHQGIDDIALGLGDNQRRRRIGESILGDGHHDQAGGQEFKERHAADLFDGAAERQGENRQEQEGRDDGADQGLGINLHEAPHFAQVQRPQADPVGGGQISHTGIPV